MKNYAIIQPEVIVGLGDDTIFKESIPPLVTLEELHINLEDWLGDDLMECYPAYIITSRLKEGLENQEFTGFTITQLKLTTSEYFENNFQLDVDLPQMYWMKINGRPGESDIVLNDKKLLIDQPFLDFLQNKYNCKYMDINPERNEFDDFLDSMLEEN